MKKITLCVVTSTRAEFGLLLPLLRELDRDKDITLRLVVTGAHFAGSQGNTIQEIAASGIQIDECIDALLASDTEDAISKTAGLTMILFSEYFRRKPCDMLIVLGDRYEIFAVAAAAAFTRIPIAHIHGGEATEGLIDEFVRHSITKMSCLHFASCEPYRRRIIQLGESPERVFNVGALGVDNYLHEPGVSMEELSAFTGLPLASRAYAVVTFHPVTLEDASAQKQVRELIAAMDEFPQLNYIITGANADAGGEGINRIWREAVLQRENWAFVPSLGMQRYVTALRHAYMLLGNSSSGMLEAPAAGIPTVNIGDRQRGRLQADSIINCPPERRAIANAMQTALLDATRAAASAVVNPYGDGHAAERIAATIRQTLAAGDVDLKKRFYDVDMEGRI